MNNNKDLMQKLMFGLFKMLSYMTILILFVILGFIVYRGAGAISWNFLTGYPEEGMTKGGIFPAIVGTLCLVVGSMVFAFPIGVMSGIYTSEYAGNNWLVKFIRVMMIDIHSAFSQHLLQLTVTDAVFAVPAYGPQNDVTLKMPAFEWVHVQLHQQKGMISLSPPTICNSAGSSARCSSWTGCKVLNCAAACMPA